MHCISISYKTTPIEIREQFSFRVEEQIEFARMVMVHDSITGCVVVSTCNRSEIYFSGNKSSVSQIEQDLADFKDMEHGEIRKHLHVYTNEKAIRHLYQVACGLDSMVLGEDEILRQVKDSYQLALEHKCTNNELNIIFQGAMSGAKLVKTDTDISTTPVSIGTLTSNYIVDFLNAEKYNKESYVLIVGATGKIGSIVAKNLSSKKEITIIGTSRNHCCKEQLFSHHDSIKIVDYKDRYEYLSQADVVVSATTSPHYTFTYQEVKEVLHQSQDNKLFLDLSVPCDIDKDIESLQGIKLLDIDFFEKLSKENNLLKLKELDKVQLILDSKIEEIMKTLYFQEFYNDMDVVVNQISKDGIPSMLYQLKDSLNSEQLRAVLTALQDMTKGGR